MRNFNGHALSIRGHSHVKGNIARQDQALAHIGDGWAMAAVSDGHGGDDYFRSHIGAKFAVESALKSVLDFLRDKDTFMEALQNEPEPLFRRLKENIIHNWNSMVIAFNDKNKWNPQTGAFDYDPKWTEGRSESDSGGAAETFSQDGISPEWEKNWLEANDVKIRADQPERLYGCTLLAAVMAEEFHFTLQIGDGCCVIAYPDGTTEMPVPIDDDTSSNVTDSLCEWVLLEKFHHSFKLYEKPKEAVKPEPDESVSDLNIICGSDSDKPAPVGIAVSTDGLFNSFSGAQDFLRFNLRVLSNMEESVREAFSTELEKHLNDRSRQGSSDDISIALVFDGDMDFEAIRPK